MNKIFNENCLTGLKKLSDQSINCCVTSPPYFGLRDYGTNEQIGLESTPEIFVQNLVDVFREVKRVLTNDGTLWLNIGDSYNGNKKGNTEIYKNPNAVTNSFEKKLWHGAKTKDLIGIPWMVAFALRQDGWYLRQDIIWHKPNPMPESVTDRCTKSHEYIFLLSKSPTYYYDHNAIKVEMKDSSLSRLSKNIEDQIGSDRVPNKTNGKMKAVGQYVGGKKHKNLEYNGMTNHSFYKTRNSNGKEWESEDGKANKRSVWTVTTKPFKEAHFATFPEDLIVDCIKAGCPLGGIVLDPFMGAGTTALVSRKLDRNYVGFELNKEYIKIAERRLVDNLGIFI